MDEILNITSLTQVFGTTSPVYAVDDVSFTMPKDPTIFNLVGESGSGKTTIARIILGLQKPTSGHVFYSGKDIFAKDRRWQSQFHREVQVVFQNPYSVYNPTYKVDRVLNLPIRKFRLNRGSRGNREMIEASLRAVDLRPGDVLGKYPHQLSGGQRQRVMLARIHLIQPHLIIADEAVSMVDAAGRVTFLNILLDFRDRLNISTLYITHDLSTAQYLGGNIIVLYKGRIVENGQTKEVTQNPLHPYARLLIQSIPIPNPTQRWIEKLPINVAEMSFVKSANRERCLFAERCPDVMDQCWNTRPQLRKPSNPTGDSSHEVACHLYR
jgi:oligopeptide/dipeptide ABC transporter ATP-binding protein